MGTVQAGDTALLPGLSRGDGVGTEGTFLRCIHAHCASYYAKVKKCLPLEYQESRGRNECGNGFVLVGLEGQEQELRLHIHRVE